MLVLDFDLSRCNSQSHNRAPKDGFGGVAESAFDGKVVPLTTGASATGTAVSAVDGVASTAGVGLAGLAAELSLVSAPAGGSSPAIDPEDNDTTMTTDSARIARKSVKVGII